MSFVDIFRSDAFSFTTLTDAFKDSRPYPGRLGEMGLFRETSVPTLSIAIERVGDLIQLVSPSPRGGPGSTRAMPTRSITSLEIPHFERGWSVYADEVQGARAFGSEYDVQTVQNLVAEKVTANITDLDLTAEYARLGAIQGIVTYKGGEELNLFSTFGYAQPDTIDFDLDNPNPVDGALRKKCSDVIRAVRKELGGVKFDHLHAFVGDDFFDDLLIHREVRETYKGWSEAQILRESYVGKSRSSNPTFEFGGIVFENYGAIDDAGDGALLGIDTNRAQFVPVGVNNLFRSYYAPADFVDTVNMPGQRLYVRQQEMPNGKGVTGVVQSNMLHICTRPGCLLRATRT